MKNSMFKRQQQFDKVLTRAAMQKEAVQWGKALILSAVIVSIAPAAMAEALPWEKPLCTVAESLSGPVANTIGVICIVLTGLALAFGEVSGVFKTMLGVLFGLSVAFLANSWLGLLDRSAQCFRVS